MKSRFNHTPEEADSYWDGYRDGWNKGHARGFNRFKREKESASRSSVPASLGQSDEYTPEDAALLAKAITQNDAPNATIVTPIMVFAAIRRAVLPARRIDQRIRTLRKSETVDYTMAITVMTKQAATIRHAIRSAIKP